MKAVKLSNFFYSDFTICYAIKFKMLIRMRASHKFIWLSHTNHTVHSYQIIFIFSITQQKILKETDGKVVPGSF